MSETPDQPQESDPKPADNATLKRAGINFGAFVIVFLFVWLIFDNMALGLLAGLIFAGGGEVAQRAAGKSTQTKDDETPQP